MAVFRVEKNKNYTVMSNVHLRDSRLSLKAKGLLAMILSLPDDWKYSIEGLAAISKESRSSINSGLRELEAAGYLTRRQLRDEKGHMTNTEYTIYEEPRAPCVDFPQTGNPQTDDPAAGVPSSGEPSPGNCKEISKEKSKTEKQNTDVNKYRFNSYQELAEITAEEMRKEREAYAALIKQNIEYDFLIKNHKLCEQDIEEIFSVMLDTVCSTKPLIRIGGDDKPADVVKSQLLKLDYTHVEFVLDCMKQNTSKIRNIRQYLLTSLYNSVSTISTYYGALVNHDMYGGTL